MADSRHIQRRPTLLFAGNSKIGGAGRTAHGWGEPVLQQALCKRYSTRSMLLARLLVVVLLLQVAEAQQLRRVRHVRRPLHLHPNDGVCGLFTDHCAACKAVKRGAGDGRAARMGKHVCWMHKQQLSVCMHDRKALRRGTDALQRS